MGIACTQVYFYKNVISVLICVLNMIVYN